MCIYIYIICIYIYIYIYTHLADIEVVDWPRGKSWLRPIAVLTLRISEV